MKVIIADDEYWVVSALESMLEELEMNISVAGIAEDGQEMLELVESMRPDLAFVDICMPNLEGLAAIKRAREISAGTEYIILSGYSDFKYAQEAIGLGVSDYILKPMSMEKLRQSIDKIVKKKQLNEEKRAADFKHFLISSFHTEEKLKGIYDNCPVIAMSLYCDCCQEEQERKRLEKRLIEEVISSFEKMEDVCTSYVEYEGNYLIITGITTACVQHIQKKKDQIKQNYLIQKKKMSDAGMDEAAFTGIVTEWRDSLDELKQMQKREKEKDILRILYGINTVYTYKEFDELLKGAGDNEIEGLMEMCQSLEQLADSFKHRSYLYYLQKVVEAEKKWNGERKILDSHEKMEQNVKRYLITVLKLMRFYEEGINQFSVSEIFKFLRENEKRVFIVSENDKHKAVVGYIKDYTEKNYGESLSLTMFADALDLSPNYLSAIFHKEEKITYVRYLTKMRMEKAERMLRTTELTISEIARKVGYQNNEKYFTKVFKDFFGELPSEVIRK